MTRYRGAEFEENVFFGRRYMFINPDPAVGPGTWRLSSIDEISESGGGGGGGGLQDITGEIPITSTATAPGTIDIAIDISSLPVKS